MDYSRTQPITCETYETCDPISNLRFSVSLRKVRRAAEVTVQERNTVTLARRAVSRRRRACARRRMTYESSEHVSLVSAVVSALSGVGFAQQSL